MDKSISSTIRLSLLFTFLIYALIPSQVNAESGVPPLADVTQRPLAAPCGTVTIQDNIVAANSTAPFTFYYDIGPQDNVAGMYIGYSITNSAATPSPDIWVKLDTFSATTVRLGAGEDGVYHLGPLAAGETKPVYFYLTINGDPGDIPALNETFQVNIYNNDPTLGGEVCDTTDTINAVDETIDANSNKVVTSVATANPPTIGSLMTITVIGETGTIGADKVFKMSPASLSSWPADTFKMTGVHVDYWNNAVCLAAGGVPGGAPTNQYDWTLVFQTPSVKNSWYRIVYSFRINGTTTTPTDVIPVNEISSGQEIKHTGAYANPILPIQSPLNSTTLSKTVSPSAFPPATSNTITYTVTVSNTSAYEVILDGFTDTLPTGTTYVPNSTTYNGSSISDPTISGNILRWTGMFIVPATGGGTLVYQAQRNPAVGTYTNSVIAKIGSVQIDNSLDTGNSSPAQATYTVATPNPALSIDKTSPTTTYDSVGDVLTYSYLITNSGNLPLTGPFTVVDDKANNESCPSTATLAPAATITCSASYTVTQADIDAGSVTNHAFAQGNYGAIVISSAQDSVTINATKTPALALEKSVLETSFDAVGDTLTYSYKVTNTGNTTLFNISVADDKTTVTCPDTSAGLAPLGVITCTATYTITGADITNGVVTNTASASSGSTTSNESSATVTLAQGTLRVVKVVVNDNGGTLSAANFSFSVNSGATIPFEADGQNDLTVIPGTYTVSETPPAGYAVSTNNCTNVAVPKDGTATCTITNDDIAPSLTLVKTVTNNNGGSANAGAWTLTATGPTTFSGSMSGAGYTTPVVSVASFDAGTYTLSESGGPAGYAAGTWSCEDAAGSPVAVTSDQVVIGLDDDITCTINNDDIAVGLTVKKVVINDNGGTLTPDDFSFSVNGGTTIDFEADGENLLALDAGTYSVTESAPVGYSVSYDSCSNVTLASGSSATCTITNDDIAPSLTLIKTVTNDNGGTAAIGDWTLTATGSGLSPTNLSGTSGMTSGSTFKADTYALGESNGPTGYTSGTWSCVKNGGDAVSSNNIALAIGDVATCTINNNDIAPSLKLVKSVVNDNGGTGTAADWTLTAAGSTLGFSDAGNSTTFHTVQAGVAYTLSENSISGYTAGSWNCDIGSLAGNAVTLLPNQNATCTITNDDLAAQLTVRKVVVNDNGGTLTAADFSFSVNGGTATGFEVDGENLLTLDAGTYSITESAPAGYSVSYDNCSNVTLANNGSAVCTITNDDIAPSLTLVKTVTNDDLGSANAGAWTLTASGPTTLTGSMSGAGYITPIVSDADFEAGTYTLSESGGPAGYTAGAWSCQDAAGAPVSVISDQLTIGLADGFTCTINNNDNSTSSISVAKASTTTAVTTAGQVVPYTFTVTNSGSLPLTHITVSDPRCDAAPAFDSGDANTDLILQVSETWIYTCDHTVTQAELDEGGYLNNTVTTDSEESEPAQDVLDIPITQGPAITLTKNGALDTTVVAPDGETNAGDTITYTFVVENTGNVSLTEDIAIADVKLNPTAPNVVCSITLEDPLEVGETASCTATLYPYVLTLTDITQGFVENTADAATTFDDDEDPATDPVDVTDSDEAVVETNPNPKLSLEKIADPTTFTNTGDVITYSYTLTNTGNVTLYSPYYVTDDHISTVNCPTTPESLAPGESVTCSAAYIITAEDVSRGSVTNVATAFAPWLAGCTLSTCVEIADSDEVNARIIRSGSNEGGDGEENEVAAAATLLPATGFAPGRVSLLDINDQVVYAATEMRLEIPGLGVNMPITGVPFKNGTWNVNWLWNQAGWLEGTAFPTSSGNSVITSHVYLSTGKPGPFVGITNLRWGDQILIRNGDTIYVYEVRSVKRVKPESVPLVMKHETLPWLTLLTCQGYNAEENSYDYRVAVQAVLVEVR